MKSTIQSFRAQLRRACGLARMNPNHISTTILRTPLTKCRHFSIVGLILLFCLVNPVSAQPGNVSEYRSTDTPLEIPDKDMVISELEVSEFGQIIDLNVKVTITHGYAANLDVFLIAPDGARVELFTDVGGFGSDFIDTVLDDQAAESVKDGRTPFTGSYRPEGSLDDLIGIDIHGTWALEVTDDWSGDTGTVESWCLIATLQPKEPLPAPVIDVRPGVPGGMRNDVFWDDVGPATEYESTLAEDIPSQGTLSQTLAVDGSGTIQDLNVKVNISHEWDSELDVYLVAPDGTRVELFTDVGGSKDHFIDTILDDQSSESIKDGTAPFTGQYRPEGSLSDLIGKDLQGEWTLEVTDDSWYASGTLNSWSLIANVVDVVYYVECGTNADFGTVAADSGWIINQSHLFADLDPDSEYWYRAKARPLNTWSQTSVADFEEDVLTDAEVADPGDVLLPGGGDGLGPEVQVIGNPSFEEETDWFIDSNNFTLLFFGMGIFPDDVWVTDGRYVAGVIFTEDFEWNKGDYADWIQPVDWTGVDTLVLDYCSSFGRGLLISSIRIGDTEVWADHDIGEVLDPHIDITIDVSGFTGTHELRLRVEVDRGGGFLAAVFWDNLRTYGPSSPPSGTVVSPPISIGPDDSWDVLVFDAEIPEGTELTVDVLPETGSTPIDGYENVPAGIDLSGLGDRTIRLRANLSTSKAQATPVLHSWSVAFSSAGRESDWSNVVSSLP